MSKKKKHSGNDAPNTRESHGLGLTPAQKNEILRCLEDNTPLPDKYRFLLFGGKREVELLWNGKTNEVCNVVLPFQTIEHVDEPRSETYIARQPGLFDSATGRQLKGWTNKLIWGDNRLILSSLTNGPMREEIEKHGGLKLIYIDPPFDVGADFSMDIEIGGDTFTKEPNVLEELAYRDTWGKGADSFIAMIYERLRLMHDLLADDGSIYVHCDWRVSAYIRLILDEVFGKENFQNEIIWYYTNKIPDTRKKKYTNSTDTLLVYNKKQGEHLFNWQYDKREKPIKVSKMRKVDGKKVYIKGEDGKGVYELRTERTADNIWKFASLHAQPEILGYPTQKPEALIERVIKTSSNENNLIADFFCGSGTTAAIAERLGRRWIVADLGKFAIHTTRKRMIAVQREQKANDKDYRAFEVLNLGKYERQHYIGVTPNLPPDEREAKLREKEQSYVSLIVNAYHASSLKDEIFHAKKAGRMVVVGPINLPVSRLFVEGVIVECRRRTITRLDILAFEFEMGLFPDIQDEAKRKGIDLALKYIPRDVFDKRAVERNEVVFHDVSHIEATLRKTKSKPIRYQVELTGYAVYYSQDSATRVEKILKSGKNKIIVENGGIIKVTKDKKGICKQENLIKHWADWVDYWSVDFDYESKKEYIRQKNEETGKIEQIATGDYIFENEWQSFRTRRDRSLELQSVAMELPQGRRKIAVKVVDIFGNDTMKILEVNI